jgi:phage tail-like protein
MKVTNSEAVALPDGRIILRWVTPSDPSFRGVRILRRLSRYPDLNDLDTDVQVFIDNQTQSGQSATYIDGPLPGELVYYYAIAAYDSSNRSDLVYVSAMAVVPYGTASQLYRSLPEIYQIFDRAAVGNVQGLSASDRNKGPLLRFIELIGQTFDLLRSQTSGMKSFHDVQRVDGALLPLLAQWIGQPSDTTLDLERQRNEIRYAPYYYRTAGTAANLRATVNRVTNWDAKIKEFVHNVFLSSQPEQLTIWEMQRQGTTWHALQNLNLEVSFEGRVSTLRTKDNRTWLFFHALKGDPARPTTCEWHIYAKFEEQDTFLPAIRLTAGADLHKHPSAVQRADGTIWLFYARYQQKNGRFVPGLALEVLSAGRPAMPARIVGTISEPFTLDEGDTFQIGIANGFTNLVRTVTARAERIKGGLKAAPAEAVTQLLNRELPGVNATVQNGAVVLSSLVLGAGTQLNISASPIASKLGLPVGIVEGSDASRAQLTSSAMGPFHLKDGDTLVVKVDHDFQRTLTFKKDQFADISKATAAEVCAAIESQLPGVASAPSGVLQLTSLKSGASSLVSVLVTESTAAGILGFGQPLPDVSAGVDEDEPTSCVEAGNIWLFWASRRDGTWKIWYTRFNGATWETPKALTTGAGGDREPFVVLDSAGGRLWVFWSRKKDNGFWNIFSRTTTVLNFPSLTDANWNQVENSPETVSYDNREPAAAIAPTGKIELYFTSNRTNGWNIWTRTFTPTLQGTESAVTNEQATYRAPSPLRVSDARTRLFLRSNDMMTYTSTMYPKAQTYDARYSGSTSVDMRNPLKLSLRGNIRDLQRYTHDARRDSQTGASTSGTLNIAGLYARDSAGVYLTPDTNDEEFILRQRQFFVNAIQRFAPIQVRMAFLIDQVFPEFVYTYDEPNSDPQYRIGEQMIDTILPEVVPLSRDSWFDRLPNVRFLRTWVPGETTSLPELSVNPSNLESRLYTPNVAEGE